MSKLSLGYVTDTLKQQGYIENIEFVDADYFSQDDSPWFMKGLMGIGGWIAAIFLLGSVGLCISTLFLGLDDSQFGIFIAIIGIILLAVTTYFNSTTDAGIFRSQLSLSVHGTGHFLLAIGFTMAFELWNTDTDLVMVLLFVTIVQIIFIFLYKDSIYRFLATLAIIFCLSAIAYIYEAPILISLLIGGLMILAISLWADKLPTRWQIQHFTLLEPIRYGAIIGAFAILIYEVTNRYFEFVPANTVRITTAILFFCLIWLETQLLDEYEVRLTSPFALAIFAISLAISIPIWTTPGILAGIISILLAFRRRNRILLGISYLYLAGFISYYYYWLDVTLLTKSIILVITGILFISARFILRRIVTIPDEVEGATS